MHYKRKSILILSNKTPIPITNNQKRNGSTILGNLFPKNDLISQIRPKDKAPESIRNISTPHLKKVPIISVKNQLNEGIIP